MNDTITSVGGRAPPVRKKPKPYEESRWPGVARSSRAPAPSAVAVRPSPGPDAFPGPVPLGQPTSAETQAHIRSSRRSSESRPTASRTGRRAREPSEPLARGPLVKNCLVVPWTPSSLKMESPENPVRFIQTDLPLRQIYFHGVKAEEACGDSAMEHCGAMIMAYCDAREVD